MPKKLLYITFISMENTPVSGSSVRPQKMQEAFNSLDIEVRTFDGANNSIRQRKKAVSNIKKVLNEWKPDVCYIEPPSGPMFYWGDIALIKRMHRIGVPISLFYRDAYWKHPEYAYEKKLRIRDRIKRFLIKRMQIYQWNVFRKSIDLIYFPSETMAKEFDCRHKDTLPPGGFLADVKTKEVLNNPLQFIFVGGAAKNHGTFLTIEAFDLLNVSGIKAKVTYVCPQNQWDSLGIDEDDYKDWLEVVHTSGDANLKPLYEQADVALLIAPRTTYRDFAVPIKIYEYISYLRPIFVTNCTETARIVNDNQIGWIVEDDIDSIVNKLTELCSHPEDILTVSQNMFEARNRNLWTSRAQKVIQDFETISSD